MKKGRKKMKSNMKKVLPIFTMILLMTSMAVVFNPVQAFDDITTYVKVTSAPSTVGVGQLVYINAFLSKPAPTVTSMYGDYYDGTTMEVTRPDGTKQTLGPFTHDAVGGCWASITPDQVGEYTIKAIYPGQTLTGDNDVYPGMGTNLQFIGTILLPSVSSIITLTVQEEPISTYQSPPLPTAYWSRPIYSINFEWAQLGGSWLGLKAASFATTGMYDAVGNFQAYSKAPNTGHILWTKPTKFGGQPGAPISADQESQYTSTSILYRHWEPIILNGILYYTQYPTIPQLVPSWIAVDVRTGETVWTRDAGVTGNELLRMGQIWKFHTIQEYGSLAFLWSIPMTGPGILRLYDAMTGENMANFTNADNLQYITDVENPANEGTLLGWDTEGSDIRMWNSTLAFEGSIYNAIRGGGGNRTHGMVRDFRPFGEIDFQGGYQWSVPRNFTIDGESTGNLGVGARTNEVILLRSAPTPASFVGISAGYQITVGIDARTGTKLWGPLKQSLPVNNDISLLSARDGVYVLHDKDMNEAYGYSLTNGKQLWGPVKLPGNAWSTICRAAEIAYGKVYIWDFGGYVNAFDLQTGAILWTFTRGSSGYDTPYGIYPLWHFGTHTVADGKLFLSEGSMYNPPLHPGARRLAIDCETGELVWSILSYSGRSPGAVADGLMVAWNSYDTQIYTFGKGQTATTISASPKVLVEGDSVLIEGLVIDESPGTKDSDRIARFPNGVPAIADEYMSTWMEYVYMQQPKPTDATGVEVILSVLDSNNNIYEIGRTTSNIDGSYGLMWEPEVPGQYEVRASFEGSESYWGSHANTYIGVIEAPLSLPEPTATPGAMTDTYLTGSTVAILAGLGIAVFLLLRKK